jgi:hypothetical protein
LYQRLQQQHGRWMATCMEASMLYNLPLIFAIYVVIGAIKCATMTAWYVNEYHHQKQQRHSNPYYRSLVSAISTVFPLLWVIGVVWSNNKVNNIQYFATTIIWALTANFFNDLVTGTVPRTIAGLLKRPKHQQQQQQSHYNSIVDNDDSISMAFIAAETYKGRTWWTFMTVLWVIAVAVASVSIGIVTLTTWFNTDQAMEGMHRIQCPLFLMTIGTSYIILLDHVKLGPTTTANNSDTIKDDNIVQRQLTTLTIIVMTTSLAGPVTLMGWEHAVRWSSWWALMSLFVPMILLIWLYHYYYYCYWNSITRIMTRRQYESTDVVHTTMKVTPSTITNARHRQHQQQQRGRTLQSIFILVGIMTSSPWILTRGSGYLAPLVVQFLAWTELLTLAVRLYLVLGGGAEDVDTAALTLVHSEYKSE